MTSAVVTTMDVSIAVTSAVKGVGMNELNRAAMQDLAKLTGTTANQDASVPLSLIPRRNPIPQRRPFSSPTSAPCLGYHLDDCSHGFVLQSSV